jgi:benzoyl-CoA 2,3-dioxygenase component B
MSEEAWKNHQHEWMPSPEDYAYVRSLMNGRVVAPGKFANWIAPPSRGVNNQPLNFEYVRFN